MDLKVSSLEPDGVDRVRRTLMEGEKLGLRISYISSPKYMARYKTKKPKTGEKEFEEKLNKLVETGSANGCDSSFERIK